MLTKEENELLCRIGPQTPMGDLFRRYWHPICLSEQLPTPDCAPLHVRHLGEDYVAFRDTNGRIGLLDEFCMHRGASLTLGRVEECGIRCIFHGWKFSVDGELMEVPNHPDPAYMKRHKAKAYPVREAGGMVWAYTGPADKEPPFPDYPFFAYPPERCYPVRVNINTNYLQNLEGGLDSSHSSSLHSDYFRPQWREGVKNSAMDDMAPRLEVENTQFGYHYAAFRSFQTPEGQDATNIRIMPFILPSTRIIPGRRNRSIGGSGNAYTDMFVFEVPIDDENTAGYIVIFSSDTVDRQGALFRLGLDDPRFWSPTDYNYKPDAKNRWGQDRSILDTSWTGFKGGIYIEDAAVIGSMGSIYDRTREHLVPADLAIVRARRILLDNVRKVQRGEAPIGVDIDYSKLSSFDGTLPTVKHWRDLVPGHFAAADSAAAEATG